MNIDETTAPLTARSGEVIPRPRQAAEAPNRPSGQEAWIEPWLFAPRTRPPSRYWDVETASWAIRPSTTGSDD